MITGQRRSSLYVPGDSIKMLQKSASLPSDVLVLNLEDGVAGSRKNEARANVGQALESWAFGPREIVVRINGLGSQAGVDDLVALMPCRPDGICLPKVEEAREIQNADVLMSKLEVDHGLSVGGVKLHAMIESAGGVMNAAAIARASPRMSSLMFGSADFTKDMRCQPDADRSQLSLALQMVVTAARAGGIDATDAPCFDLRDADLLRKEAQQARRLGYAGKSAIHPNQLDIINSAFEVTPEEIAWAERVLAELNEAESRGKALATLEGHLVENPHRTTAEHILRRSRRR